MTDLDSVRLDIWLDVACLCKTRSQAQTACKRGRVKVNGQQGKAHRSIRPGDEIRISIPGGNTRIVVVTELESRSVPRARARELYDDRTPAPTREELEIRRMLRLSTPVMRTKGSGTPKKKERRLLRRAKEDWADSSPDFEGAEND
ncbi:MAG: hypothetical protein K8R59_09825 [Thermoanaerobaculales bacterium]|nr:hypothetical protein [Thermoanaerobaculales bacterium]